MTYEIRPARPTELPAAHLLLTGQASVTNLGGADSVLGGPILLVALRDEELCSAVALEKRAPGLIAIVLPLATETQPQVREQLLEAAVRCAATMSKRALVLLLEPDDPLGPLAAARFGFRNAANVTFLARQLGRRAVPADATLPQIDYCPCSDARLTETVAATLIGSLDCPALLDLVGAEEMLTGFANRANVPDRYWRLAKQNDRAVGCLLVSEVAAEELELMYMGVVPEERGRGLGRALVAETLVQAERRRIKRIALAVDESNAPALRIYYESGFTAFGRRVMWCAVNRDASESTF